MGLSDANISIYAAVHIARKKSTKSPIAHTKNGRKKSFLARRVAYNSIYTVHATRKKNTKSPIANTKTDVRSVCWVNRSKQFHPVGGAYREKKKKKNETTKQ